MNIRPQLWLALVASSVAAATLVGGCGSKKEEPSAPKTPPIESADPQPVSVSDLPEELKTDAYEYYGLGNTEPMDLERSEAGSAAVVTGSQTVRLKEIQDGKAIFVIERTGGFAQIGDTELSLEPDGIYAMSSSIGTITPHQIEMPSKLEPGTTWTAETKLDRPGGFSLENKTENLVVGIRKVTTKAGTFDALLIESSGPAKVNGEEVEMRSKMWFVKGLGAVKMELTQIPKSGEKTVITVQATK